MPGGCSAGCGAVWFADQALSASLRMRFGGGKIACSDHAHHPTCSLGWLVELSLFESFVAWEECAHQARASPGAGQRLREAVRSRIVASLPKALDVNALAAEHGMSGTHFSRAHRAHACALRRRGANLPSHAHAAR